MKNLLSALLTVATLAFAQHASALDVFACEPEWGALVQEIGGDRVSIYVATNALQDPHQIQAKPSLLARARRANLVVCTGSELEIGWLPVVLRQSGNSAVQPDKPGYFEAANYVQKLEVPTILDRAAGDIHPGGNPHIQTDPRNIGRVATALAQRMGEVDPANASYYQTRYQDFAKRWDSAIQRWQNEAAPLKGIVVVAHHKSWVYLYRWLGMREIAELEPKPGVEPTAAHLEEVLAQLKREPARMVIRSAYEDARASEWLAERAKIPAVMLPFTVGGSDKDKDLFGLYDDTVQRLLQAVK
ncbi:metal ABC transporter substrate-binding protein [Sulfuricaulis sp.]|jgi:zinc/manganese transport system substrate-binding protein|uniref:metal ABC transporter substrate-binding protein n=1 Tax=Sulfuricaulis sp. TaxID=2003553 RepID=UPI00355A1C96